MDARFFPGSLYKEDVFCSEHSRREYARAIESLSLRGFSEYPKKSDVTPYEELLGAPLDREIGYEPTISREYVGEDSLCEIFRLRITVLPSLPFFGLMFVPKKKRPLPPLTICVHGHLGTPELMYGMHGKNGYSDIIARLISEGFCVFSPQLLIWNFGFAPQKPHYDTKYSRHELDTRLKAHGGGIVALETFCILQSITALFKMRVFDTENLSVSGMSYGAFYTMRAMALDERIRKGYFMSCFDGGLNENFPEWFVREKALTPRDGDVAALIAPRPILIEVGEHDEIFPPEGAKREAVTTYRRYKSLGAKENFNFRIWNGGHIVCPENFGINFLKEGI